MSLVGLIKIYNIEYKLDACTENWQKQQQQCHAWTHIFINNNCWNSIIACNNYAAAGHSTAQRERAARQWEHSENNIEGDIWYKLTRVKSTLKCVKIVNAGKEGEEMKKLPTIFVSLYCGLRYRLAAAVYAVDVVAAVARVVVIVATMASERTCTLHIAQMAWKLNCIK